MSSNFTADGFTPRYTEEPLRSHRELNEIDQAHRDLTPRYRAALENTRGVVEQYIAEHCTKESHEANWDRLRRDDFMPAYLGTLVLDCRTCLKCGGSTSREVEATTEAALDCLRKAGLL